MLKRRTFKEDRGAVTLSYALLAPVILMLIFATIQFVLLAMARNAADAAASAGLRAAATESGTAAAGETASRDFLDEVGGTAMDTAAVSVTDNGVTVTSQVTIEPISLVPLVGMPDVTVTQSGPKERVTE